MPVAAPDFVVVGSGSGGAAVTRRLIDAGASVVLIEVGPVGFGVAELDDPTAWVSLAKGPYDWGHDYAPTDAVGGRAIPIPRGRVLGGSSATNAMMWYRGHPADYDLWAETCPGWGFSDCLPAFRACEDWEGGASALRGAGGPLRITRPADPHPLACAMIEGAAALGLPVIDDPNGMFNDGAALANLNIAGGRRWSSAEGYLKPVLDHPALTVMADSRAVRLVIAGTRVQAVEHRLGGALHRTQAGQGVILCGGAIETPRLLILSGIGPAGDLARLGVPVCVDAPEVGQNLQDHPLIRACNFRARRAMGPLRDNGGGAILNWRSTPDLPRPDLHAFPVQGRSAVAGLGDQYRLEGDLFAIGCGLMGSRSRGEMRVLSADPDAALHIQPNFLGDPADLAALRLAVEFVLDLVRTAPFSGLFKGYAAPEARLTGAALDPFIRSACSTFFHTCGTARMGGDAGAVTSPRLKVNGTDNLWIADASVIPVIPSCNTHAPVTMIGERAAAFLLEDA